MSNPGKKHSKRGTCPVCYRPPNLRRQEERDRKGPLKEDLDLLKKYSKKTRI